MISNRKYILHSESDNLVNQWHFSNAKILALVSVTLIILGSFLLIGADYVSKVLYDKRLKEFKANYSSVVSNIDKIQSRLKELDQQILDIEEKDIFQALFPGGSITGAPKESSMKIIDEIENYSREIYTGSIGLISSNDDMIFNIAIKPLH